MNLRKKDDRFTLVISYKDMIHHLPLEMALAREDLSSRFEYASFMVNNDTGILSAREELGDVKMYWNFHPENRRWVKVFDNTSI